VSQFIQQVSGRTLDGTCSVCLMELCEGDGEGGIACLTRCSHALHVPCLQSLVQHQSTTTKVNNQLYYDTQILCIHV
jgi:hypothetical protein